MTTASGNAVEGEHVMRVVVGPLRTNCYVIGRPADEGVIVIDPGADAPAVRAAVNDRRIAAIVLTHCHFDHVGALPELLRHRDAPVYAHDAETAVWQHELDHLRRHGHFDADTATSTLLSKDPALLQPDGSTWNGAFTAVSDGHRWRVGDITVDAIHTPGHTPGGLTLRVRRTDDLRLLTGDTVFPGGPGLTGWPLSDFETVMTSVRRLFAEHPASTRLLPGHGAGTTVGRERPDVEVWQARGW